MYLFKLKVHGKDRVKRDLFWLSLGIGISVILAFVIMWSISPTVTSLDGNFSDSKMNISENKTCSEVYLNRVEIAKDIPAYLSLQMISGQNNITLLASLARPEDSFKEITTNMTLLGQIINLDILRIYTKICRRYNDSRKPMNPNVEMSALIQRSPWFGYGGINYGTVFIAIFFILFGLYKFIVREEK